MSRYTLREKLRYSFDNTMSKGAAALVLWLGILSVILIAVMSLLMWGLGLVPEEMNANFFQVMWMSLMRTMDAGTMGGDEGSWAYLFAMFVVTLGGVFIISTLIGVLTSGIEGKLEELRKGRSKVIEHKHTVVLGWSDHLFTFLSELVTANENEKDACIVVLSEKDKVEMEDEIKDKLGDLKNTRIVCRTGSPIDLNDLEIAGIHTSKSIVVFAPEIDDPDPEVVKIILAITNHPRRRKQPYHIVAELHEPKNVEIAKMVGRDEVELVVVSDLVARIIAQTCRQSGLSMVYQELLDFDGDEIYFFSHPSIIGKTYGETLAMFEKSAVLGLYPNGGTPALNPPMETIIKEGDRLVVIAADNNATRFIKQVPSAKEDCFSSESPVDPKPENTLLLGWNFRAPLIINQLDAYVAPGSIIHVVANQEDGKELIARHCTQLKNCKVAFRNADTTDRKVLDSLHVQRYHHIILLSYADQMSVQEADARTLFTLLHLRDIADKSGKNFSIVSEILDVKNRELAEVTKADDFIVSDKLISLMLSQVSENKMLNAVFADIFDPEGAEIYLKPSEYYVKSGVEVDFFTVIEAARRRNETAIGYKLASEVGDADKAYGVHVNPTKSQKIVFGPEDKVIVAAED